MIIGVARVTINLNESHSLKDKRQVVKSIKTRVQNKFNVAVAEVEDLDDMRIATLGIVCLSTSAAHADQVLATVISFIEQNIVFGALGEIDTELIPFS